MSPSLSRESGEAVQILKPKTFELDTETLKNILEENSDKPVAVISITGAFRTGKSFLLNFFLRYLRNEGHREKYWLGDDDIEMTNGFEWQAGDKPHTSGIWIWNKPFVLEDNKGQQIAVILMDTQGNFSHDCDQKTNTQIFALSTLLSSLQIVNVHRQLQANDLEYLQYFTDISRISQRRESSAALFQGLTFLVRDWPHLCDFKYGREGGNQYLEKCLGYPRKSGEESMKQYFLRVFENLDCFLIPHPGSTALCGSNFTGKLKDINDDFIKEVKSLTEHVLHPDNLIQKTVAGEVYTGKKLWLYAKRCNESVKNGPDPKTYIQAFAEFVYSEAVTESINSFNEKMNKLINSRHGQKGKYQQAFDSIKSGAFTMFDEHGNIGRDYKVRQKYRDELKSQMDGQYKDYKSQLYDKLTDNLKRDMISIVQDFESNVDLCLASIFPRLQPISNKREEAREKLQNLQDALKDSDFFEQVQNLIKATREKISLYYNDAYNKIKEQNKYYFAFVPAFVPAFVMVISALYVAPITTCCLIVILVCLYNLFGSLNIGTVLYHVLNIIVNSVPPPARYFVRLFFPRQTDRPN